MQPRKQCRVCQANLSLVLDLGTHALSGQFPAAGEPDPPAHSLRLMRCGGCGLVQLDRTVPPEQLFTNYFYRSSISATMNRHLNELVTDALSLVKPREWPTVLDIGCNDQTLLKKFGAKWRRTGIDPSVVAVEATGYLGPALIHGYFPQDMMRTVFFDLIFSVAMFYDIDAPIPFARSVRDHLAPDGLWCVEVADLGAMIRNTDYAQIVHEHLCYYDPRTMFAIASQAGLRLVRTDFNPCNGGSRRYYFCRSECTTYPQDHWTVPVLSLWELQDFATAVEMSRDNLYIAISELASDNIHILGASTKLNTVLQYCDLGSSIAYASDRDPRKHGRRTPGTNIPIISEAESRQMNPDAYLVGPGHFRYELIQRERDYLDNGGKLIFTMPRLEIVSRESSLCLSH